MTPPPITEWLLAVQKGLPLVTRPFRMNRRFMRPSALRRAPSMVIVSPRRLARAAAA